MKTIGFMITLFCAALFFGGYASSQGFTYGACSQGELCNLLDYLPSEAPVILVQCVHNILPERKIIVVGTGLYRINNGRTHSAKLYIFTSAANHLSLLYQTDMDKRIVSYGLPADWEIRLNKVQFVDLTGDGRDEIVVFWDSKPWTGISLTQYTTIVHVYQYTADSNTFIELTGESIVFNTELETAFLFNVDADPETEIVLFKAIWESDSCVTCAKRFQVSVWTLAGGRLVLDPKWNSGKPYETNRKLSIGDCSQGALLRLVLAKASYTGAHL